MSSRLHLITNTWQGVFATDFTLSHVRQRCQRLSGVLRDKKFRCLVAYDTRFMSNLFAQDIYRMFAAQGVPVSLVPAPVPLPAIQYAINRQQADCALVVSARNRPYWYNGLVLLDNGATGIELDDVTAHPDAPTPDGPAPFPATAEGSPAGQTFVADSTLDLRNPYIDALSNAVDLNLIRRVTLTIFVDPMHGTLSSYLPAIIGEGNYTKAIEINRETDPLFSKFTPLPAAAGLARLSKLVRESDSHVGLAFSADGTALGVVEKNGEQLSQIEIVLLLASYLARQYRQKGIVIVPPSPSTTEHAEPTTDLAAWESALGFKVEIAPNATERIIEYTARDQNQLLVGCTTNGELILPRYSPYPDALLAGLLIAELIARAGGSLRTPLEDLRSRLDTRS